MRKPMSVIRKGSIHRVHGERNYLVSLWCSNFITCTTLYGNEQSNEVYSTLQSPDITEIDWTEPTEDSYRVRLPLTLNITESEREGSTSDARNLFMLLDLFLSVLAFSPRIYDVVSTQILRELELE